MFQYELLEHFTGSGDFNIDGERGLLGSNSPHENLSFAYVGFVRLEVVHLQVINPFLFLLFDGRGAGMVIMTITVPARTDIFARNGV